MSQEALNQLSNIHWNWVVFAFVFTCVCVTMACLKYLAKK